MTPTPNKPSHPDFSDAKKMCWGRGKRRAWVQRIHTHFSRANKTLYPSILHNASFPITRRLRRGYGLSTELSAHMLFPGFEKGKKESSRQPTKKIPRGTGQKKTGAPLFGLTLRPSVGNPLDVSSVVSSSMVNASASALVETIVWIGWRRGAEGRRRRGRGSAKVWVWVSAGWRAPVFFFFFWCANPRKTALREKLTNRVISAGTEAFF